MTLGSSVKAYREKANLSQSELAEKAGISQAEVSRIEKGRTQYSRAMPALARALGCTVADLSPDYASEPGGDKSLPLVPVVEWDALSGDLSEIEHRDFIQISMVPHDSFIATVLRDDSADRIAPKGATIVIDTADIDLKPDVPYLFVHEGNPMVRYYRRLPDRMHPATNNLNFETQYCTTSTSVIGRVRFALQAF